ncbi:thiosulfate:glutathione sulfurtransferase isoform X2 [Galendromus occidentalis]|uniref:Thiosulfate:glutathione sulfurtransferase isoform X2 n=1 Tax=Galendromus occidentalis TaxID=34638 RepID=A0AAJ7L5S9_9ACAR|nr:thiosulfate:glutathione sulfurtransferase isoform X2 [Galendromus occidentalis]
MESGSVNIPLGALDALIGDPVDFERAIGRPIGPSGRNVILSCRSGRRALLALDKLKAVGYNDMKIYKGSFMDWQANGGEVFKAK